MKTVLYLLAGMTAASVLMLITHRFAGPSPRVAELAHKLQAAQAAQAAEAYQHTIV